jgi:hypothetical protein
VIELSKYILEALVRDKDFNLYCATSKEGNSQILVLPPAAEYPPSETLERLEYEYSLREELDLAWAARPIETARYRDSTVLVLDDPGVPLDQLLSQPLDAPRYPGFSMQSRSPGLRNSRTVKLRASWIPETIATCSKLHLTPRDVLR